MNARTAHIRASAMWDGRCAPWLQTGAVPGSIRTKSPPRVQRAGTALLPWPPQVWAFDAVVRDRTER
jgi:hypothetical protein